MKIKKRKILYIINREYKKYKYSLEYTHSSQEQKLKLSSKLEAIGNLLDAISDEELKNEN